jgi:hypothetical protein
MLAQPSPTISTLHAPLLDSFIVTGARPLFNWTLHFQQLARSDQCRDDWLAALVPLDELYNGSSKQLRTGHIGLTGYEVCLS